MNKGNSSSHRLIPPTHPPTSSPIQTVFNLLPNLNVDDLVKGLMVKTNDMHVRKPPTHPLCPALHSNPTHPPTHPPIQFVIYLSALIRAIAALHGVVQNKIDFKEQEEGGGGGGGEKKEKKEEKKEEVEEKDKFGRKVVKKEEEGEKKK